MIHIYDEAIMAGATYTIEAISDECSITQEYAYSKPLTTSTSTLWADVVGDCDVTPCTVPDGVVDFDDITAVVEKFSNEPGAPIKSRADLINSDVTNPEPDRKVDFVDITFCVDAFRGFEQHPNPYLGPDPDDYCPYVGDCYADIRVDSNNDGVIDDFDEAVEDTSTMFLVVNSDDDDESGYSDFDEAPVVGEDDLAEVQLTAACEALPGLAWWSLSWEDTEAPIKVWRDPDKSGDEILNWAEDEETNKYYDWPPPESVWIESYEGTDEDFEITFKVDDGTGSLRFFADGRSMQTGSARVRTQPCTPAPYPGRYYVGLAKAGAYTGIEAWIFGSINPQRPLCDEARIPHQTRMMSATWIAVANSVFQPPYPDEFMIWVQMGFLSHYAPGGSTVHRFIYVEALHGPDQQNDRYVDVNTPMEHPLPDFNVYNMHRENDQSEWTMRYNLLEEVWSFEHWIWNGRTGNQIQLTGELLNKEDTLSGTQLFPCELKLIRVNENFGALQFLQSTPGDLYHRPLIPDWESQWGLEWVDGDEFMMWDKVIP